MDTDARLQASRRLDWRFLLPDPALGEVAYLGPADSPLAQALRLFSGSISLIEAGAPRPSEVVVLSAPPAGALERAVAWLRPGGWLYIEAYRLLAAGRAPGMAGGTPGAYRAWLARRGFEPISLHAHWPSFEASTRLVPLDDPGPMGYLFGWRRQGVRAKAAAALGRSLVRSGLAGWLAPCFSVVAQHKKEQPL